MKADPKLHLNRLRPGFSLKAAELSLSMEKLRIKELFTVALWLE